MTRTKKRHPLKAPESHRKARAAKVYWPYLPLMLLLIGGLFMNLFLPFSNQHGRTLAFATEISRGALLSATNSQRASNGAGALTLNSQLNGAAQAKANDMIADNYWSHDTPEGQKPWVFIDAQGYSYQKAGENLAYGYPTSSATVIGWMNSATHRANMLDTAFIEVGFGFANSENFVGDGQQTVVVAMYAQPAVVAATPAPTPTPEPSPEPTSEPAAQVQPSTTNQPAAIEEPEVSQEPEPVEEVVDEPTEEVVITDAPSPPTPSFQAATEPERTSIIQMLTGGYAPWSSLAVSIIGAGLSLVWLVKHGLHIKKYVLAGEHFLAHHPIFDVIVVGIITLAIYLTQTSGVVL